MPPRTTPFQSKYCLEFGLDIVSRDKFGNPTVRCNFCAFEARQVNFHEGGTRKRKSRDDTKYFTKPFAPLNYRCHLNGQHKESWEAYQQCSTSAKMAYFKDKFQSANTLHIHIDLTSDTIEYTIRLPSFRRSLESCSSTPRRSRRTATTKRKRTWRQQRSTESPS